jgi:tetratricopeptide (TPR) repeat protein
MQPWFLPRKLGLAIRDLLPPEHRHKMRYYFEDYGCLVCGKKDVPYGSNTMCRPCATGAKYRFFFAMKRRWDAAPAISRGRPMKRDRMMEAQRLLRDLVSAQRSQLKGTDVALARLDELKADGKSPGEEALNQVGYRMLKGKIADAIKIFSKNVHEYPQSANPYDSLADGYAAAGENEAAIENYRKALKIDPANEKANAQLEKLGARR